MKLSNTALYRFFKLLMKEDSGVSSKRFIALTGWFTLVVAVFVNLSFDKILNSDLVYAIVTIILSMFGISTTEKIFSREEQKKVDTSKDAKEDENI